MSWLPRLEMLQSSRVAVQFPLMVRQPAVGDRT